ncbi:MAG: hypothetical protein AAGG69_15655 [Pseudomonadota bacterium]
MRLAPIALFCGLLALTASVDSLSAGNATTPGISAFPELSLGMSEQETVEALSQYVSHPLVGYVCNGEYGVSAYVPFRGQTWQLMAHVDQSRDAVSEIRLLRSSRQDITSHSECAATFEKHLAAFEIKPTFTRSGDTDASQPVTLKTSIDQNAGLTLHLSADRSLRPGALCHMEIIATEAGALPAGWSVNHERAEVSK